MNSSLEVFKTSPKLRLLPCLVVVVVRRRLVVLLVVVGEVGHEVTKGVN